MPTYTCAMLALLLSSAHAAPTLSIGPGGHTVCLDRRPTVLVGESGTQCVMQNANIDYRRWVDDCAAAGLNAVHIWSFMAPRQTQDGRVVESRYGYVYPGLTPWARCEGGPPAADGLPMWDLTRFDDGKGPGHYWWRLSDLCDYAGSRGLVVGITVFFGWPKHRGDWEYHPLNVRNGGPVEDTGDPIAQAQRIHSPGTEVLAEAWSEGWPVAKKTQWVWERFADRLARDLAPRGNVFFVFMDEHSYSEGNCGDHFAEFFRRRGALWCDWDRRREMVDLVAAPTLETSAKNPPIVEGVLAVPARPYVFLEGPPYTGDEVRRDLWAVLLGGGHFFLHNDERQETEQTGIMGYDRNVVGGDTGAMRRGWLGHACRFLNRCVGDLDALLPHNELCQEGWCLASPGREFIVYARAGRTGEVALDLTGARGAFECEVLDPRTGELSRQPDVEAGGKRTLRLPNAEDWVVHLVVRG